MSYTNNDPFAPWNTFDKDNPSKPWNGYDADNPLAPWNNPFGHDYTGRYEKYDRNNWY